MKPELVKKESFAVIGKEGSSFDGDGFIQKLWADANAHFSEVQALAKKNEQGFVGIWGAMSDMNRTFAPWENDFTKGLYLAGVECDDDAEAPDGWTKWVIPGLEAVRIECEDGNTFAQGLEYLRDQGLTLAGAVQDFTCPQTGKNYMLFPIRVLV